MWTGCPVQEKMSTRYRIFIGILRSSQNASYVVVMALLSPDPCAESRNGDLLQNAYINLFMQVFHSLQACVTDHFIFLVFGFS